jgi:hypothetical protein
VESIKGAIETKYGGRFDKLDMHLSVVLDEAGALELSGHFEKKNVVTEMIRELEKLATSVRLVICGTGLAAENFSPQNDAFKFRLKRWGKKTFWLLFQLSFSERWDCRWMIR